MRFPASARFLRSAFTIPALAAFLAASIPAAPEAMVISEVMFNPDGNENAREFIEVLNPSGEPCSFQGCRIGDGTGFETIVPAAGGGWTVPAGGFALILDPDYFTAGEPYPGIPADTPLFTVSGSVLGSRGLSNSTAEAVTLISAGGDTLSVVRYSLSCPSGHSWERIRPSGSGDSSNFAASLATDGTPGFRNSVTPPERNPALVPASITFDSTTFRMGGPATVSVSCRNAGLAAISGVRVRIWLDPDTPAGVVDFPDEILPGADAPSVPVSLPALPGGISVLTAAIEGETAYMADDTLRLNLAVPVPAGTVILNEVMAAPARGAEWAELLNTGVSPVSLRGWTLSDSDGNRSGAVSGNAVVPAGGFALLTGGTISPDASVTPCAIASFPALNNDGDTVRLHDHADAPCDSMSYTTAESGVSRELIAPPLRGSASAWDRCTDSRGGTPGARNSIYYARADTGSVSGGANLVITPNPFSESAAISYDLPFPLARVRITVYDRRGRFVTALRESSESGSTWSGTWDGRAGGHRLPAGPYLLFFEATDKATGETTTIRKTIVVGAKL